MHAGAAIWNLHALITYLERNADPGTQKLLKEFGHDSVDALVTFLKYRFPAPDQLSVILSLMEESAQAYRTASQPQSQPQSQPKSLNADATKAVEHCDYIIDKVPDLPDGAEEFANSVNDKATSMKQSILQRGSVTPKMLAALENMRAGVDKWLRSDY